MEKKHSKGVPLKATVFTLGNESASVKLSSETSSDIVLRAFSCQIPKQETILLEPEIMQQEWLLALLRQEDKDATEKSIISGQLLEKVKEAKIVHGQWIALLVPCPKEIPYIEKAILAVFSGAPDSWLFAPECSLQPKNSSNSHFATMSM